MIDELLKELEANQPAYAELNKYATGTQPLAFISPNSRKALGNRLDRMVANIPALAVSSLVERLRPSGFSDPRAWELFVANDLDQLAADAMSDALAYGTGFILVWAKDGKPTASVESPENCAVIRDPADRSVIAGIKRYATKVERHAYVYTAEDVQHWRADSPTATSGYTLIETIPHSLNMVPLVPIDNGRSEITDLMPLCDGLNKLLLDMLVASEAAGKGRRWVTGLELIETPVLDADGNPILEDGEPVMQVSNPVDELASVSWAIGENEETKFGSFGEASLVGFEAGTRILISQIMAVSALPSHYLGVLTAQPSSADALRAAEASLVARAESRALRFGRAFEKVARLLLAVDSGRDPAEFTVRIKWAPCDTRSVAQEMDATVKAVQSGLLPVSYALVKLGYSESEIADIQEAFRRDTQLSEDGKLASYLGALNRRSTFEPTDAVRN